MTQRLSRYLQKAMAMLLAVVLVLSNVPLQAFNAYADDGNLITNGDFEENLTGWKSAPVGNYTGNMTWEDGVCQLKTEDAFGMENQVLIAVQATGTYSLSYKASVSENGVLYAYIYYFDADGVATTMPYTRLNCACHGEVKGKKCTAEFTVPADAAQISVNFVLESKDGTQATATVDNVKLYCERETGSALNGQNLPGILTAYDAMQQKLLKMILRAGQYTAFSLRVDFEDGEELPWSLWSGSSVADGVMTQSADSNGYAEGTQKYSVDSSKVYELKASINVTGRAQAVFWIFEYDENDAQINTVPYTAYYSRGSNGWVDFNAQYTPSENTTYVRFDLQTNEGRNRGGTVQWEYVMAYPQGEEPEVTEPETTEPETTEPETTEPETTEPETTEPETTEPETTAPAGRAPFAMDIVFDGEELPWNLWSGSSVANGVLTQSADSNGYAEANKQFAVDSGKTYEVSASIQATGRAQAVYWFWEYDESGKQIATIPVVAFYANGSNGWVDFNTEYTPSANTAYVLFHLQTNEGQNKGGTVQWENVTVKAQGEEPETTEPETTEPEITTPDTSEPETTAPAVDVEPFEMNIAFDDGEELPWTLWAGSSVANGVLTQSADADGYAQAAKPFSVETGKTYAISSSIQVTGRGQAIYWIWEFDANANQLATIPMVAFYASGTNGWVSFNKEYTPSANTAYILFHLQSNEGQNKGGTVQWDNVQVQQKGSGTEPTEPETTQPTVTEPVTSDPNVSYPLNGDFEQGSQYWSFLTQGEGTCAVENIEDNNVLKMDLGKDGQAYTYCNQIPVKPNYVYTVSYKVKVTPDSTENLVKYGAISIIQEFSADGVTGHEQSASARNNTDGWETVTYEYITGANATAIRLDCAYVNNPGTALWDDFSVVEKEPYNPEILDAGYDHGGTDDTANPDNLIANGTFDGGNIVGWAPKEGVAAVQTANENGGVVQFNAAPGRYLQSNELIIQGLSEYQLTYYVKVEDASNLEFISYFFTGAGQNWNDFIANKVKENTDGQWQKVQINFTVPALEEDIKGFLGFKSVHTQACDWQKSQNEDDCTCKGSGTIYLDDISLIRLGEVVDLGDGKVSDDSLVMNGTFDLDQKYWDVLESGEGKCSIEKIEDNKVLQTKLTGDGQAYFFSNQVPVKPNYIYTVSYKVKVTPDSTENLMKYGAISVIQEFSEEGATGHEQSASARNKTDGWETITYEYITSATAKAIRIDCAYVNNPGVALWDDFSIVEKEAYEPEILGAEYDHGGTDETASADNIITNSTFYQGSIVGWAPKEGVAAVQTEGNGGVVRFEAAPGIYMQSSELTIQGLSEYQLTYYVKVEDASNLEFISYFFTGAGQNWNDFVANKVTSNTNGKWQKVQVNFTVPALEENIKGFLGFKVVHTQACDWQKTQNDADCTCKGSGTVYLDDISLIRLGEVEDLGDGKVSDDSLVMNGTFDLDQKYWDVLESGEGKCTIETVKDNKVMQTKLTGDGQAYFYSQQIPVKPNYVYTVSYKVKVTPDSTENLMKYGAISIIQEFSDSGVTGWEQSSSARNNTDGWETVTYEYITSPTAKAIRIDCAYVNNPGVALWDDFSVVEKEAYEPEVLSKKYDHGGTKETASADNLITNSTFDQGSITGWSPKEGVSAVQTEGNGGVVRFYGKPGRYMQSNELAVQGESRYELTYYVKVEDADNLEFISYFFTGNGGSWTDFVANKVTSNTNGKWQKVQVQFNVPAIEEGTKGFLGFQVVHTQACQWQETKNEADCTCNGSGTVYLDDISLIRLGYAEDKGDGKVSEDSLVMNGTFDLDNKFWDFITNDHGTYAIETGKDGNNVLKMKLTDATGQVYGFSNQIPVKPNYVYVISYKVKVQPDSTENLMKYGAISVIQEFSGEGVTGQEQSSSARNKTDGWETVTYEYATSATAEFIRIDFQYVNNPGSCWWDDFSIVEKEPYVPEVLPKKYDHGGTEDTANPDNMIPNGTFDNGSILGWSPKEGVSAVQTAGNGGVVRFYAKPGRYLQSNELNIQGESEYELTYYVKVEDAENLEFIPYFFTGAGQNWRDFLSCRVSENTNGKWQKIQIRFATPALEEGAKGFLGFKAVHTQACDWQFSQDDADCTCKGSATIYLDDISLIRKGEVKDIGPGYASEGSILYNGSFDRYCSDPYMPDGWAMNQLNPNHDTYVQSEVARSGNAVAIHATGHSYFWAYDFAVEPGNIYILSYWVKVDEAKGLKFAPYINDANYKGGWWLDDAATPVYDVTEDWVKITSAVSIPASVGNNPNNPNKNIQLGFQVYEGSGVLYLDDVSFVKTDVDAEDPNLDFELSSEILYNWASASFGGKGSVTPSSVVRPGSDSTVSADIYNAIEEGNTILISQMLPVKPKTTYEFSYWVRIDGNYDSSCTPHFRQIAADGVSAATSLAWDGNNNVTVQSEMISPFWTYQTRGNIGWRQVSMSVTTGPDTHFVQLRMSVMGDHTHAYIDDVTLREAVQDVNLDFELTSSVTGAPANWYISGGGATQIVSESDTTMYHSGKQSYHIKKDSLLERSVIDSCAFIPVDPDMTYEFSFWMSSRNCSPTATIRMNMQLYTADGTRIYMPDGNYRTMQGTVAALNGSDQCSEWTKVVTRAKPVAEAAYATISFAVTRGDAEIWIDDIFMEVVEDGTDCVVYYDDFHALDQDGNTGWTMETVSGEAEFTSGDGGKLTISSGESYVYNEMKQMMTEYSYTVKGNYSADIGGTAEMRFYDYMHNEIEDSRVKLPLRADAEEFTLSFTAPSNSFARLYIGSDQQGTINLENLTIYMVAKPADSSDWDGLWVWYPENPVDDAVEEYRFFRYTFYLDEEAEYAPFQLTVDDKYAFYLNGELVDDNWDAGSDSWANVASYDLTDKVQKGKNVIALKCYNLVSEAAILFDGKFTLKDQSTAIVASSSDVRAIKTVDEKAMDWIEMDFDDTGWTGCKEYGQPPCSPWGPVFYDSTLYINNVAQVLSTSVPESVTAGRDLVFTMTLQLDSPIEANFTPTVTVYKRNSITSITSVPLTFETYDKPLQWPVGEPFEVQCRITIPDYMQSGKYTLQMDENMLLLTGEDIYDNKFLDFKAVETSAGRDNVVSSVEVYNGVPTLIIDGEPMASHFYLRPDLNVYLQTDAETRIYKSDLELFITYGGGLYKGGCDPIWLEDGTIDYEAFDSVIYETLAASNDALVMVNIGMFAPKWWMEQNPDHVLLAHNGSQYIELYDVSLASEKFRQEAGEVLRLLLRHMKEQSYYNRVYGLKISGGQSYEWMCLGTGPDQGPDYSPVSQEGFKKYLKRIYGTEEALQEAWGDSSVTFENATAPGWNERSATTNVYMGDADTGELSRNMVDWNLWLNEASADSFLYYCQIAKEETDNQIIVGGYNGYLWTSNSYDSQGMAHTAMDRVLDSEYVDWIASPIAYNERLLGESNTYMPLLDSVQEHGKLYIAEQDNRTVLSSAYAGAPWDADWDFSIGQTRTVADTIYQQKRDFANALVNSAGLWQYDMYGGWLDDDQIYQYFADAKAEYDFSVYLQRDARNEVAIFVGDETYAYMKAGQPNMPYTLLEPMLMQQRKHLANMGAGYDTYALSSLLDGKVEPHKLNIVFSPFEITEEMNAAIDKYLKCNGQYVVWIYLPGISNGYNLDPSYMKRVTGFDIGVIEEKSGLQVQIAETNNVLTKGIEGLIYGNSTPNAVSPMPYIKNTSGVEVLGYNLDNNQGAGLGIKDMGEWVSIYSAAPCLDVRLLRNLLKLADCHIYSENNEDVIYSSNHYVALHSGAAEEKTITLDGNYAVYDVFEQKFVSMDTNTITYNHAANDTHIFRLMTPNTYAITARIKSGKGTLSAPGLTEVSPGDSYSLTVTPDEGYEVALVTVNGEEVALQDNTLKLDSVDGNQVIQVRFNKLPEMVEVIEYVQELIILPWPAAIGIVAVFAAAVWGINKGIKTWRRKREEEEGGY